MKDFIGWNNMKSHLDSRKDVPTFQQREIWWCSIGVNVGHESDGKSLFYNRPVLVIRKFNRHLFLGVPLSTQLKTNSYYHRINFKNKEQCIMLSQIRLWESKRLGEKMGKLPRNTFDTIRLALQNLI